ncbi:hypothetical protein PGTUg99_009137 [Puccinia graminis f. sp. tritici]|uniref:Uncharacterized protein n=1 Tax=Puccinia graminis f. sp. tritici TaxID=56615 RepID=A0A5B0RE46_PUCGR|nr:hypothetical protein PGTUg99_009137 [Puccinia graminis f. sp. tritici]
MDGHKIPEKAAKDESKVHENPGQLACFHRSMHKLAKLLMLKMYNIGVFCSMFITLDFVAFGFVKVCILLLERYHSMQFSSSLNIKWSAFHKITSHQVEVMFVLLSAWLGWNINP